MSKEWDWSIPTETLNNIILITIDASKDFAFYADSKHIKFVRFNVTHQRVQV